MKKLLLLLTALLAVNVTQTHAFCDAETQTKNLKQQARKVVYKNYFADPDRYREVVDEWQQESNDWLLCAEQYPEDYKAQLDRELVVLTKAATNKLNALTAVLD